MTEGETNMVLNDCAVPQDVPQKDQCRPDQRYALHEAVGDCEKKTSFFNPWKTQETGRLPLFCGQDQARWAVRVPRVGPARGDR